MQAPETRCSGNVALWDGSGIDRARIFRKQEEDFQGAAVVLSDGGEEDRISRSGSSPFPFLFSKLATVNPLFE